MSAVGYVVKSMTVKLKRGTGADVDVACAIRGVTESPSADTQTTQTACPDGSISDTGPTSWTLTVDYNVSNKPDSFHRMLREHEGEPATITVEPFPISEPGYMLEYDVTLTPAGAGYIVGQWGEASATLPMRGKPRNVDPAPPVAQPVTP